MNEFFLKKNRVVWVSHQHHKELPSGQSQTAARAGQSTKRRRCVRACFPPARRHASCNFFHFPFFIHCSSIAPPLLIDLLDLTTPVNPTTQRPPRSASRRHGLRRRHGHPPAVPPPPRRRSGARQPQRHQPPRAQQGPAPPTGAGEAHKHDQARPRLHGRRGRPVRLGAAALPPHALHPGSPTHHSLLRRQRKKETAINSPCHLHITLFLIFLCRP
jgi:hypothetical protein